MGRSHGGLTTKIHAVGDGHGLPIPLKPTEGQAHDGTTGAEMLGRHGPDCILLADRGYDSDALRAKISKRGAYANIRPLDHRVDPPAFSPRVCKLRSKV